MKEIDMKSDRASPWSKEDIMKELSSALVMYYGFKNASEAQKWFYRGQVIALEGVAMKVFGASLEEVKEIEGKVKEKFDKIGARANKEKV